VKVRLQPARSRRRPLGRLVALCLTTSLAMGLLAGVFGPRILVGGVPAPAESVAAESVLASMASDGPLGLAARLGLEKREIKASEARWAALSPADRESLLARYQRLVEMDESERSQLIENYAAFRQLPADRQVALRKRAAALAGFIQALSPQDQARLESMSPTQRALRLLELWQAREGN
jgi:hypothetical protein